MIVQDTNIYKMPDLDQVQNEIEKINSVLTSDTSLRKDIADYVKYLENQRNEREGLFQQLPEDIERESVKYFRFFGKEYQETCQQLGKTWMDSPLFALLSLYDLGKLSKEFTKDNIGRVIQLVGKQFQLDGFKETKRRNSSLIPPVLDPIDVGKAVQLIHTYQPTSLFARKDYQGDVLPGLSRLELKSLVERFSLQVPKKGKEMQACIANIYILCEEGYLQFKIAKKEQEGEKIWQAIWVDDQGKAIQTLILGPDATDPQIKLRKPTKFFLDKLVSMLMERRDKDHRIPYPVSGVHHRGKKSIV